MIVLYYVFLYSETIFILFFILIFILLLSSFFQTFSTHNQCYYLPGPYAKFFASPWKTLNLSLVSFSFFTVYTWKPFFCKRLGLYPVLTIMTYFKGSLSVKSWKNNAVSWKNTAWLQHKCKRYIASVHVSGNTYTLWEAYSNLSDWTIYFFMLIW